MFGTSFDITYLSSNFFAFSVFLKNGVWHNNPELSSRRSGAVADTWSDFVPAPLGELKPLPRSSRF